MSRKAEILQLLQESEMIEVNNKRGRGLVLKLTPSDCKASMIITWIEAMLVDDNTTTGEVEQWLSDALFWVKFIGALAYNDRKEAEAIRNES